MNENVIRLDGAVMKWLRAPHAVPVSQVQFDKLLVEHDDTWSDKDIILQFIQQGVKLNVAVVDGMCDYPEGLIPGVCAIAAVGYPKDTEEMSAVIASANRVELQMIHGFDADGSPAVPPSPDLYVQLLHRTEEALDDRLREAKESGDFDGADGFSPTVAIADALGGHMVTITDKDGVHSYFAADGQDGEDGQDGFSPVVAIEQATGGATVRVTDRDGTTEATIRNGTDGQTGAPGADGFSPVITVSEVAGGHNVNVTDKTGDVSFFVADGPVGPQGEQGIPGKDGTVAFEDLTPEQRESLRGDRGPVGPTGPQGPAGSDASVTEENIRNALGYQPADPSEYRTADAQDDIDNGLSQRIDKVEAAQRPDAVEIGTLTVNGGNVSGFTNTDYMIFNFIVDLRNKPFMIEFAFTTGSDVNTQQNILDSQFGLALAIRDGKGIMALSSNGTSWDIGLVTGTMQIMPNSHCYARIAWDGTSYTGSLSTDGQTYIPDMHAASSLGPYPRTIYIGGAPDLFGAGSAHPFHGTIDFTDSRLYIEGQEYWHGMGEVGLASRANVSLSNLDALGLEKFERKQEKIADLAVIREGAELGRTAIQGSDMTADNLMDEAFGVKQSVINAMVYKPVKRYGIRIKQSEPNPSDRVEYLYDAVGMEPAYMDYASGQFHFGGWSDAWFVKDNFPCMVKFDGTMDYKLNPNDYSFKADGGASDFENVNYAGNAMSALPLIWVKKYTEGGYKYKIFSNVKYDYTYEAYPYTRPNGTIADYLFYPMVKGYRDSNGRLRSIGGVKPTSSLNATQEKAAAIACGDRWGLVTWQAWNLIMDLQELMTKSTTRQAKLGRGHDSGGSSADNFLVCGSLKDKGQCYGYNDGSHAVKFLHIENPYGERWERLEGMLFINGVWHVKDTPGEAGYNFTGSGFTALTDVGHPSSEGWVKEFTGNEHGDFPLLVGGSDATYECDYYYQNAGITSVPIVGAACNDGSLVGRYVVVNNPAGAAGWNIGASPFLQNPS